MRIVFSRDRAAQLDLLLRSLDKHAPTDEPTQVLWWATDPDFRRGYRRLAVGAPTPPQDFDKDLRWLLSHSGETVTFFCDDDVVFRPVPYDSRESLAKDAQILCHSWRLPSLFGNDWWYWHGFPRHDHGYPGSIDGHTFRTADVLEMIGDETIANPLILETVLALRCEAFAERRPLMAAWPEQVLVGVPVNTVSDDMLRPNGQRFPQSAAELNRRFLDGERIDLDRLDFSGVDGVLHEIEFAWR